MERLVWLPLPAWPVETAEQAARLFAGLFAARDLTFEHQRTPWARVVEVWDATIDFHSCRFTGGCGMG